MTKLLTIGIPTYNRALLLDRQLAWLYEAVQGLENSVEIIISDNCSSDDTQKVVEKWRPQFSKTRFVNFRQPVNLGAIGNINYCVKQAQGQYVWVVSDDDRLKPDTVNYVINNLSSRPDLALIVLNHGAQNFSNGRVVYEQCYPLRKDAFFENGKALFSRCLLQHQGGITLTTALVYKTSLVQESLSAWPEGIDNFSVQTYMTAYCALHGSALLTSVPFLNCSLGDHWFIKNKTVEKRFEYVDKPAMYRRLSHIGYGRVLAWKFGKTMGQRIIQTLKHPSELSDFFKKASSLVYARLGQKSA